MSHKKSARLPLIAFATLPLTVGLVFAAGNGGTAMTGTQAAQTGPTQTGRIQTGPTQTGRSQPAQPGQTGAQTTSPRTSGTQTGTNHADVFLQKLAAGLGISVERLRAAAVSAGTATIDQGVKAGEFPSDRAAEMKSRLTQNPFGIAGGRGGFGGRGGSGRNGERGHGGERGGDHGHGPQGNAAPADQGHLSSDTDTQS